MYNTIGDVALMNISRERNYHHDFVSQYPKQKFFDFPQPQYVRSIFLNFGHSSAQLKSNRLKFAPQAEPQ